MNSRRIFWYGAGGSIGLALFSLLVGQVALALGLAAAVMLAAGLYTVWQDRQTRHALTQISQLARVGSDLSDLLDQMYPHLARVLPVDNLTVVLAQQDERRLDFPLVVRAGRPVQSFRNMEWRASTLTDHVLRTRESLLLPTDVHQWAQARDYILPDPQIYSWLGVPLLAAGQLVGAIILTSTGPRQRFTAHDQRLLEYFSPVIALAIHSLQLHQQRDAQVAQLSTLNEVVALLTETLSPDAVLDTVISSASAVAPQATAVAVFLSQDNTETLVRCAGMPDDFATAPPSVQLNMPASVYPLTIESIRLDMRAAHLRETLAAQGKQAVIELPLVVSGERLGTVVIYYDEVQVFDGEKIELLRAFANQAAQAIQNADLYAGTYRALERRIEQLSVLAAIGREMTAAMDLQLLFELMLEYALTATGASSGGVVVRDDPQAAPQLVAALGYGHERLAQVDVMQAGITAAVLHSGQPALVGDVAADTRYLPLLTTTRAQISVPINWRGTTAGVLTLEGSKPNMFSAEDVSFVTQLCNQVMMAVDNVRLFGSISEARDRMQAILDAMDEAIILVDREGRVALTNPRVTLIGLEPAQLDGVNLRRLPEDGSLLPNMGFTSRAELDALLRNLQAADQLPDTSTYGVNNGQSAVYVERQVIPVQADAGAIIGLLLVYYDQTEQRELQHAREVFSQMIVHDLRSPLTAVTSSVMLLTELIPPDSEYGSDVARTARASQRAIRKLLNRVDSLLDISRLQSGQMPLERRAAAFSALVDSARAELDPLAYELEIAIRTELAADLPPVDVDADKIERVLTNLLDNALKFSPSNTQITVRSQYVGNGFVRVDVIDQGPGIPPESRANVFDRFVQVKANQGKRRGSGLGLAFCRLAVEAHGGAIWLQDNPDGGSIFAFTLPVAATHNIDTADQLSVG